VTLADDVARFDPALPLEEASSPPSSWYTDPAIHELEQRAVFGRHWLFACPTDHIADPGSWAAGRVGTLPWVVARDEAGTLRAFQNVCRHRGAEVVRGTGCGELVCRYHAWRYDLGGRLQSAPKAGGMRGFDRNAMGLTPLAVQIWGPLVLIHAQPDAAPFAVPELDVRLRNTDWAGLRWVARRSYDVGCNWKVVNDNYLDGGYHIAHMHPTLDAQIDMASYRTELLEGASIQSCPPVLGDGRAKVDVGARIGDGALYAWVHPTLMINRYGPVLDTNTVEALAADRCRVHFDFWFAGDPDDAQAQAFVAESMKQSHTTQLEDIDISESVQLGTASVGFDRGRYAPAWEAAIHHFHRLLAEDLRHNR
jgi:choline monooxygenase